MSLKASLSLTVITEALSYVDEAHAVNCLYMYKVMTEQYVTETFNRCNAISRCIAGYINQLKNRAKGEVRLRDRSNAAPTILEPCIG